MLSDTKKRWGLGGDVGSFSVYVMFLLINE